MRIKILILLVITAIFVTGCNSKEVEQDNKEVEQEGSTLFEEDLVYTLPGEDVIVSFKDDTIGLSFDYPENYTIIRDKMGDIDIFKMYLSENKKSYLMFYSRLLKEETYEDFDKHVKSTMEALLDTGVVTLVSKNTYNKNDLTFYEMVYDIYFEESDRTVKQTHYMVMKNNHEYRFVVSTEEDFGYITELATPIIESIHVKDININYFAESDVDVEQEKEKEDEIDAYTFDRVFVKFRDSATGVTFNIPSNWEGDSTIDEENKVIYAGSYTSLEGYNGLEGVVFRLDWEYNYNKFISDLTTDLSNDSQVSDLQISDYTMEYAEDTLVRGKIFIFEKSEDGKRRIVIQFVGENPKSNNDNLYGVITLFSYYGEDRELDIYNIFKEFERTLRVW